jgi:hypothetical protein
MRNPNAGKYFDTPTRINALPQSLGNSLAQYSRRHSKFTAACIMLLRAGLDLQCTNTIICSK